MHDYKGPVYSDGKAVCLWYIIRVKEIKQLSQASQ